MAPKEQKTTAYVTPQGLYVPNPKTIIAKRAPATTDTGYDFGTLWVDKIAGASYQMVMVSAGAAVWITLGGGTGAVATLTGNSGGAISPVAGNINIVGGAGVNVVGAGSTLIISLTGGGTAMDSFVPDAGTNPVVPTALGAVTMAGTANQITTTGGLNTLTFSLPTTVIVTTSVTTASFITSSATLGTTYTANSITPTGSNANIDLLVNGKGTGGVIQSRGLIGGDITFESTNTDNTNGASRAGFEAAVGGTSAGDAYFQSLISGGQVFTWGIDNSTANDDWVLSKSATLGTTNQVVIDGSTGAFSTVAGITAATTLTATLGNITTTNGNFVASTAGTGLVLPVGTASGATPQIVNARVGSVTFTGISIAAAADLTLTLTNSTITGAATRVMLSMIGATTGSALSIKSVTPSAGSLAIVVTNGTGATTTTADITFDFMVLN